jgi:hypothetical protein
MRRRSDPSILDAIERSCALEETPMRRPFPPLTLVGLLAGSVLAVIAAGTVVGQDALRLSGEMMIGGATLVDPPPGEARNTHAYLTITGPAALSLYRNLPAAEEDDLCRGDGRRMRRAGALTCSIDARRQEATCDFGVDLRSGTLAGGRPC